MLEFIHEATDFHGATGYALATFQAAIEGCGLLSEPTHARPGPESGSAEGSTEGDR